MGAKVVIIVISYKRNVAGSRILLYFCVKNCNQRLL